jgi:aminoglycoside phosphotransferase (APT) family kinase protein
MQSISKVSLSQAVIQSLVSHHFGGDTRVLAAVELTDGCFNTAYRLDLADGRAWVLKVAPPPGLRVMRYEAGIMSAEVEVMGLVQARTSMPLPEVLCYDATRRIIENEFFIMAFIPGEPLNKVRAVLTDAQRQAIDRRCGAYLREMNAVPGAAYGYCTACSPRHPTWRHAFDAMLGGVMDDGRDMDVPLPLPYDALHERLRAVYPALDEVQTPRLVHWDLWDGNVFVDMDRGEVTGIVDFERALWGDPLMEVNFRPYPTGGAFLEGYGTPMLATNTQRQRRLLYNVYLYLIMIIECSYRRYETQDQENWARAQLAAEQARLSDWGVAG